MRPSFVSAALLALFSSVVAQTPGFDVISSPTAGQVIPAGSSFEIKWDPNGLAGFVSITLIEGPTAASLVKGPVIACSWCLAILRKIPANQTRSPS